jgi:hypothetical protein
MELDQEGKKAVRKLCKTINAAIEKDSSVGKAIEDLRIIGYEPQLNIKVEIGLQETEFFGFDESDEELDLDLTDEDVRTLRRMKIRF